MNTLQHCLLRSNLRFRLSHQRLIYASGFGPDSQHRILLTPQIAYLQSVAFVRKVVSLGLPQIPIYHRGKSVTLSRRLLNNKPAAHLTSPTPP